MSEFRSPVTSYSILMYQPIFGDYIIWSRWFSTWHGFLLEYDVKSEKLSFLMAGTPFLLVSNSSISKSIVKLDLSKIRNSKSGKYAIIRHVPEQNKVCWYV